MPDLPAGAVTAAAEAMNEELGYEYPPGDRHFEELIEVALTAAAPILLAAEVSAHVAEQDAVHADLALLLRTLGMFDGARPQSPHEVMLEAIAEVKRIREALEATR